jgi:hypothetical protein
MTDINSLLQDLRFNVTHYVENRASIADLFKPGNRCGIYILHFATGEYYIGQAVDVTRRYVQHSKNHSDIQTISFQQVKSNLLNDVERETIGIFERQGYQIRNIALTSIPKGESDFDLIMPEEAQAEWLNNLKTIHLDGHRSIDPNLRRKYQQQYARLLYKERAEEAILVLREYVRKGIPAIKSSELSFWSCSCLPSYKSQDLTIYSRINIYWQEVFTVSFLDGKLGFSWHLALTPLEQVFGQKLTGLRRRYPNIWIDNHQYKPGGPDQVNLGIENTDMALELIKDDDILRAIRLFNLRLMKKGACVYSRNHCLSLADRLID